MIDETTRDRIWQHTAEYFASDVWNEPTQTKSNSNSRFDADSAPANSDPVPDADPNSHAGCDADPNSHAGCDPHPNSNSSSGSYAHTRAGQSRDGAVEPWGSSRIPLVACFAVEKPEFLNKFQATRLAKEGAV